jgi:hypothetical protein
LYALKNRRATKDESCWKSDNSVGRPTVVEANQSKGLNICQVERRKIDAPGR